MILDLPYDAFINQLTHAERIVQISHINPDADTLGSSLALRSALERQGKQVTTVCMDIPSDQYDFMPGISRIEHDFDPTAYDLIITVDCADLKKMSGFYQRYADFFERVPVINIDHHPSNDRYGKIALVAPQAASVGQIMYHVLNALGAEITPDMATQLLAALYFDTGSFQHSNTTSQVMKIAADLKTLGADHAQVAYHLFRKKSLPILKLWGLALGKLKLDYDRSLAWIYISQADLDAAGAEYKDLEGLIGLIHGIPGIKMTVLLSERDKNQLKGSIRTENGIDASHFAAAFGGGGHHKAAGFSAVLQPQPQSTAYLPVKETAAA